MHRSVLALSLFTLFVWVGRIRNAVTGDEGAGPVVLATTFVVLALLVLATRGARPWVLALAGWTVAVWAVRSVDIALLSDHDGGFVVVHLVLAAVSIGLAAWALRTDARPAPASGSGTRPRP